MKKRRNHIAFDGGKDEKLQWYWLMNKVRKSDAAFSLVNSSGNVNGNNASCSLGMRLVFKLKMKLVPEED